VSSGGSPSGLDGLVRVNSLDVDASLFRDFSIRERVRFQFRGEATNVFNFVNLSNPGGTLNSSSSFGVISGASAMRVLQVGGRLLFEPQQTAVFATAKRTSTNPAPCREHLRKVPNLLRIGRLNSTPTGSSSLIDGQALVSK